MVNRIDHIGIAVKNLDEALKVYTEALGLECKHIEDVPSQKVRVGMIPIGESKIELLESTDDDGPIAKHIEKRGEGVQHIALSVDDIEGALTRLKEKGIRLIDEEPRVGAGGARIAFVHPRGTNGVLLELVERK